MITSGIFVRLEAKPGKEADVERLLRDARGFVDDEPGTVAWFAIQFDPSTFGIFDVFPDEAARQDHLGGKVAEALMAQAPELFVNAPVIELLDVLEWKVTDPEAAVAERL
jgi:quinol monooxygenase YgiN